MDLPRRLALAAIRGYQRWISPRKGFHCAYRVHTGCAGCSALGYRVIRRFGLWDGLPLLRERMARCGAVHALHAAPDPLPARRRMPAAQRGDCDPGCDLSCAPDLPCDAHHGCAGCDGPSGPKGGGGCGIRVLDCCDLSSCCNGGCDWSNGKKNGAKRYADRHGLRQRRRR